MGHCVRSTCLYSDFFEAEVGLKQGNIITPVLFSLFHDNLEIFLHDYTT